MGADYEVGYRRPPKHTQFQKGHSGNPKGRPCGTKNLRTDLEEELAERVTIREDGRTLVVTKQRALVKALYAGTIKGNGRSAGSLLSLIARLINPDGDDLHGQGELTSEEREILAGLEQRLAKENTAAEPSLPCDSAQSESNDDQ